MSEKRYYWLKLPKDFFKRHDITFLFSLPNGHQIVLFYLELMTESIDHDGELRFSEDLPYSDEMLASITHVDTETVKASMKTLQDLKLIEVDENGTIILKKAKNMVGYETKWAEKKRAYREQKRQSTDNVPNVSSQCPELSDKSKSKSKSKSYKERNIKERTSSLFAPPTVEEVRAYCVERNNRVDPERFVDFYSSKNWFVGKNKMKDWKAAVRTWEKRDSETTVIARPQIPSGGNEFTQLLSQEGYL